MRLVASVLLADRRPDSNNCACSGGGRFLGVYIDLIFAWLAKLDLSGFVRGV